MSDRVGLPPGFSPGLQPGISGRGAEGGQPQPMLGKFQGETVQVMESPLSMLESAAEELTFGAQERMTKRELGERRLEGRDPARRAEEIERIREYLESLPDFDQEGAQKLLERLLSQRPPTREGLKEALEGFHEDITYQQAALEVLDQALAGHGDPGAPELRGLVQAMLAENARTLAPSIQAGLNVTKTAMLSADDAGEVQELRNFYRESVLSHESLATSWANIVERYGEGDLGGKIKFLLQALGADLAARGPSISPPELKAILDETHQLETLATIRERATGFFQRLQARFGAEGG